MIANLIVPDPTIMSKLSKPNYSLAQKWAHAHGMTITRNPQVGEYRVNFAGGREETAYYTEALDDAIQTMIALWSAQEALSLARK